MEVAEYQDLTGTTVSESDMPRVTAALRKSKTKLESLLGFSLSGAKKWTEVGKTTLVGSAPFPSLPVDDETLAKLTPPDDQYGDIQLFRLNELDTHTRINPAQEIYRAKVVLPINSDEFITVCDLCDVTPYLNSAGLVVAITKGYDWYGWSWWSSMRSIERNRLMLAVDGDYIKCIKKHPELVYLFTDMVAYYSDPSYSVMGNIRSEKIDSHSYTRASTGATADESAPENQPQAKAIIQSYAGPASFRKLVR